MLKAHITCSKGTYIRSLAHDLGQSLGCGGYLHDLRRTSIGMYNLDNAMNIDEVITWINLLPESQKELGHN
jgi:tRNA pseudouridine55 synthase